ncbi:hypothetical protein [Streptomyces sp. NPDC018031]|uniref:hypothetical protein n=1 Tax=Streptomyces sp. NPDC018031 TaxID=3365033 RepID=UPI0037A817A0
MQFQAGAESRPATSPATLPPPDLGLPHSRPRPVHWVATAAAIAAVVAGASILQPSDAEATASDIRTTATRAPAPPAAVPAPDARAADYPVDCGAVRLDVVRSASGDLDGDGRPETVAVVRCHSETGTPPSGVYVLGTAGGKGAAPRVVATFVDPKERMSVTGFALRGTTVSATLLGYSSLDVPRCCPDLQRKVNWQWRDGEFVLEALPPAGSV